MSEVRPAGAAKKALSAPARVVLSGLGWLLFGIGWVGVFLPGLPTTIFWILAALVFLRTNRKAYGMIISNKRFGESVRQIVEEGRISLRGKIISISAMMLFAISGAIALRKPLIGAIIVACAAGGSLWLAFLPTKRKAADSAIETKAA